MRKAKAYQQLGSLQQAMQSIEEGLSIDPQFVDLLKLRQELAQELRLDNIVPADDPQRQKFTNLVNWLLEGGARFPKLYMKFYSLDYRGVHAKTYIQKNDQILYIPKSHIITLQMAKATPIGKKMEAANLNLLSPKHSFLSSFVLQQKQKESTFWQPYFDILPQYFRNFPIFFDQEQKSWLKGSPFLKQVLDKIQDIKDDYRTICDAVPEFQQFPIQEFSKIRMGVSSRIFGMQIDGVKTDGFVPYADMLNHKRPRQTSWSYQQDQNGFSIIAMEDINRSEQVLDSYGKKCNSRFLLNYGFIVRNNDANEYPFDMDLLEDDPLDNVKRGLIDGQPRTIRVQALIEDNSFDQLFGNLRLIHLKDESELPSLIQRCQDEETGRFSPKRIAPISQENEIEVLQHVLAMAMKGIRKYPTSLEQDLKLKSQELSENYMNCLLMRIGQKEILEWYKGLAETSLGMFEKTKKNIKKAILHNPYALYISRCVLPFIKTK